MADIMVTPTAKIVLLGHTGAGKTSIVKKFQGETFNEDRQPSTTSMFMSKIIDVPGLAHQVKFQVWDTAGQEQYDSLASLYYADAKAAILVYDITMLESYQKLKIWRSRLKERASQDIVVMVVGNKSDLVANEKVSLAEAQKYAADEKALFCLASAKDGTNINEIFYDIAKKIYATPPQPPQHPPSPVSAIYS